MRLDRGSKYGQEKYVLRSLFHIHTSSTVAYLDLLRLTFVTAHFDHISKKSAGSYLPGAIIAIG
jgi:hypothetical protein